ncbi:MAG: hypothetical protein J7L38_02780 [Thermoproteales archaeon]|nr:hypothetical protein [Thermoproteales archaeon]
MVFRSFSELWELARASPSATSPLSVAHRGLHPRTPQRRSYGGVPSPAKPDGFTNHIENAG